MAERVNRHETTTQVLVMFDLAPGAASRRIRCANPIPAYR
jgi:hypothetical protein